MKQKIYTSSLVFLVMLITCIFIGCSDDKKSNLTSWPDDLPKFKNGRLFKVLNNKDTGVLSSAIFGNIKNPENAYKSYRVALINNGWLFDYDGTNEYTWGGGYIKESKNVNVNVQKDGSMAQMATNVRRDNL